jgi:tetratricopeptide (TPR) repeat protein
MRFRTLLSLLVSFALAIAPHAQDEAQDFQKAAALRSKADYSNAAAAFERWLDAYPKSPRVAEVLVQAGVTRLEAARARQMLHRNPPEANDHAMRALQHLDRVLTEFAKTPHAARAQFVASNVHLVLGDLASSLDAAEQGLTKFASDTRYAPKALLRRAELRHHLLQPELALADYQRWKKDNPRPSGDEEGAKVELALEYLPLLNKPAPPLEIVAVRGTPPELSKLRGKVIGLLFFDVECHNCPKEVPFLNELVRRYGPRGFELVALANRKKGATVEAVAKYAQEHEFVWPVALDAGATFDAYDAELSPNLVLVDRKGVARWHEHPSQLVDWTIEALLAETEKAAESTPGR